MRTVVIILLATLTLYLAYVFLLPFGRPLVQPVATWWYGSEFVSDTTSAAAGLSGQEELCIFDDSRGIFVESFAQIDVDRMIDRALDDKYPRLRLDQPQRDPHFRVLSDDRTYYWSFGEKKFFPFRGDRWSLAGELSRKRCMYYSENPQSIENAFWEREGIRVDRRNFCCGLAEPRPSEFEGCSNDWFQYVEEQISTSDGQGHGPDIGSMEWRSTVEFRIGLRGDPNVPPLESDEWCEFINDHI